MTISIEASNSRNDDFINRRTELRAYELRGGPSIVWSIPDRLLQNDVIAPLIYQELITAFSERP